MSACISRQGEFGEHMSSIGAERFYCSRCWVFDEGAALEALATAELTLARVAFLLEANAVRGHVSVAALRKALSNHPKVEASR